MVLSCGADQAGSNLRIGALRDHSIHSEWPSLPVAPGRIACQGSLLADGASRYGLAPALRACAIVRWWRSVRPTLAQRRAGQRRSARSHGDAVFIGGHSTTSAIELSTTRDTGASCARLPRQGTGWRLPRTRSTRTLRLRCRGHPKFHPLIALSLGIDQRTRIEEKKMYAGPNRKTWKFSGKRPRRSGHPASVEPRVTCEGNDLNCFDQRLLCEFARAELGYRSHATRSYS